MWVILLLLLLAFAKPSYGRRSDYVATIKPKANTGWGNWGQEEWCEEGHFAAGARQKVDPIGAGGDDDETGLHGLKLNCKCVGKFLVFSQAFYGYIIHD